MALTRNSVVVFNLCKAFPSPSSIFICRHVWKGGDVVREDNESKGETGGEGWNSEACKKGDQKRKETNMKEKATETAQEAWRAIEEVAGEMKQRVVPSMDSNKESDIQDEMALQEEEEEEEEQGHTKNSV